MLWIATLFALALAQTGDQTNTHAIPAGLKPAYCTRGEAWTDIAGTFRTIGPETIAYLRADAPDLLKERGLRAAMGRLDKHGCCLKRTVQPAQQLGYSGNIICDSKQKFHQPTAAGSKEITHTGVGIYCSGSVMEGFKTYGVFKVQSGVTTASVQSSDPKVFERIRKAVTSVPGSGCCLYDDASADVSLHGVVMCDAKYKEPAGAAATAATPPRVNAETCSIRAAVVDHDAKGLNVRSSPSSSSPSNIVSKVFLDDMVVISEFNNNGWAKIISATPLEVDLRRPAFKAGWVLAKFLHTNTNERPTKFYKAPNSGSDVVQTKEKSGLVIIGCRGDWVQVNDVTSGKNGWLAPGDHCGNVATTCA